MESNDIPLSEDPGLMNRYACSVDCFLQQSSEVSCCFEQKMFWNRFKTRISITHELIDIKDTVREYSAN